MTIVRLYVVRCKTPDHFYCGTTTRIIYDRLAEHEEGSGSRFTTKHGYEDCVFNQIVDNGQSGTLEDDMTKYLMSRYGWANCRGGNFVRTLDDMETWWLPREFREGSFRDILKLREGSVSHLGPELGRLVHFFRRFRDAEHANHLHAQPLA